MSNPKVFLHKGNILSSEDIILELTQANMLDATTIFVIADNNNPDNIYVIDGKLPYDLYISDPSGNNSYKLIDLNLVEDAHLSGDVGHLNANIITSNGVSRKLVIFDYNANLEIIEQFSETPINDTITSGTSPNIISKTVNKQTFIQDVITNNTPLLTIQSLENLILDETNLTQSKNIQFTAKLTKSINKDVSFMLNLSNSLENLNNLKLLTSNITISAGSKEITFDGLNLTGDDLLENDSISILTVNNIQNARLSSTNQQLSIKLLNDDKTPVNFNLGIQANPTALIEGSSKDSKTVYVTVSLKEAQSTDFSFYLVVSDIVNNADAVTLSKNQYILKQGETSINIPIELKGDDIVEQNEVVKFQIFTPDFATNELIDANSQLSTEIKIIDDDQLPQLMIDSTNLSFYEGDSNHSESIKIYTNQEVINPITFKARILNNDNVITIFDQSFTIETGQNSISIPIEILGNMIENQNQSVQFEIYDIQNATLQQSTMNLTVQDDDFTPILSLQMPQDVLESNSFQVVASLDRPINKQTSFELNVVHQTTNSADFIENSQTVVFAPNQTVATINLNLIDDQIIENTKQFLVNAQNLKGLSFTNGQIQYSNTINLQDNDSPPILTINALTSSTYEGTSQAGIFNLNANLDRLSSEDITFKVVTRDGSAIAGEDYQLYEQMLTIPKGTQNINFQINTIPNDISQEDRQFEVVISEVKNANFSDKNQTEQTLSLTIQDDDKEPEVSLIPNNLEVIEGTIDQAGIAEITVQLDHEYSKDITVTLETVDGTAIVDKDYQAVQNSIIIPAGSLSQTLKINMIADDEPEADETFSLKILSAENAIISTETESIIKIIDNQALPRLVLDSNIIDITESDPNVENPEIATEYSDFVIQLKLSSVPILEKTSVDVSISDHDDLNDFLIENQTVTFDKNGNAMLLLQIANDVLKEDDKQFTLEFSNPNGINILDETNSKLTLNLNDNDNLLELLKVSVSENPIVEPTKSGDKSTLTINYALDHSLPEDVTFKIQTKDDTAISTGKNLDFNPIDQTVTLKAGEYQGKILLDILGDSVKESDLETFKILTTTDSKIIAIDNQSQEIEVSIKDSQALPFIGVKSLTLSSKNNEEQNLNITVSADVASDEDIEVTAQLTINSIDPLTQKVVSTQTFPVQFDLSSDSLESVYEWNLEDHNFTLSTSNNTTAELKITKVTNATIDPKTGSLSSMIQDVSTVLPQIISISPDSIHLKEGNITPNASTITIQLDKPVQNDAGASFALIPYDSTSYQIFSNGNVSNLITIPKGQQSISVILQTVPNLTVESDKEYRLRIDTASLTNLKLSSSIDNEIEFAIENDDEKSGSSTTETPSTTETEDLPKLSVANITTTEQSLSTIDNYFLRPLTFTLSKASTQNISFNVSTAIDTSLSAVNQANTMDYHESLVDSAGQNITNLTIPVGQTSVTAYIKIFDDKFYESTEYFKVNITNIQGNATLQRASATIQINDNDIKITSLDLLTAGTYKQDDELLFTVHFNSVVNINESNPPQLALNIGGQTQYATYEEGNGSSSLSFSYKVEKNLEDIDGIEIISLDSTNFIATGNLDTTIPANVDASGILIDSLPPTLQTATVSGDQLILTFSEELQNMPSITDFVVEDDDGAINVTDITMQQNVIVLTLENPIITLNNLVVAYDPQSNLLITDLVGNEMDGFSDISVIDNNLPLLSMSAINTSESNSIKYELVTFTLNKTSTSDVTFDVMAISDPLYSGTINEAIDSEDFESTLYDESLNPISSLIIPAGQTSVTANLKLLGDTIPEATKYLQIHANNIQNAIDIPIYSSVTLTDNDNGIVSLTFDNPIGTPTTSIPISVLINNFTGFNDLNLTELLINSTTWTMSPASTPITGQTLNLQLILPANTQYNLGDNITIDATVTNGTNSYNYSYNLTLPYAIDTIPPSAPKLLNPVNPNLIYTNSNYYVDSSLASSITDLSLQIVFKSGELKNGDNIKIFDANQSTTTPIATKEVVTSDIQSVGMTLGDAHSNDSYILVPLDISNWGVSSKQLVAQFVDTFGNISSVSPSTNLVIESAKTINLTTNDDNVSLTSSNSALKASIFNDTIIGSLTDTTTSTLNVNDTIDGSLGLDTLKTELYVDPNSSATFQAFYLPNLTDIEKLEFTTASNTHSSQEYKIYLPTASYSTTGTLDIAIHDINLPNSMVNLQDIDSSTIYLTNVTSQLGMSALNQYTMLDLYLDNVNINNANSSTLNTFADDYISIIILHSPNSVTLESLYFERIDVLNFNADAMSDALKLSIRADATGDTSMVGSAYNDTIIGGTDNDTIKGELGNDLIYGASSDLINGNDYLEGGDGNDTLVAQLGSTTLNGGNDIDSFVLNLNDNMNNNSDIFFDDFSSTNDIMVLNKINGLFTNTNTTSMTPINLNPNDFVSVSSLANIQSGKFNVVTSTLWLNSATLTGANAIDAIVISRTYNDVVQMYYDVDWRDANNRILIGTFQNGQTSLNPDTLTANNFQIYNDGKLISLTSNDDNVSANATNSLFMTSSSNDTIEATDATLNASDTIDGQGGYDILNITNTINQSAHTIALPSTTSNIEKVTFYDASTTGTLNWYLTSNNIYKEIVVHNATTSKIQNMNNILPYDETNNIYPTLKVINNQGDVNFNFGTVNSSSVLNLDVNNLNSTADSISLNATSVSGASSYLGLTINSTHPDANGVNQLKSIQGNALKTLTITGDKKLSLTGQKMLANTSSTINASGLSNSFELHFDSSQIPSSPISIMGSAYNDYLTDGNGIDTIVAGAGDDTISTEFGLGVDSLDGGTGTDTIIISQNQSLTANLTSSSGTLTNVEKIDLTVITSSNIILTLSDANVSANSTLTIQSNTANTGLLTFDGSAETDGKFSIIGGAGNDSITGSSLNDTITASGGDDIIVMKSSLSDSDNIDGGTGNDTLKYMLDSASASLTATVANIETLRIIPTVSVGGITLNNKTFGNIVIDNTSYNNNFTLNNFVANSASPPSVTLINSQSYQVLMLPSQTMSNFTLNLESVGTSDVSESVSLSNSDNQINTLNLGFTGSNYLELFGNSKILNINLTQKSAGDSIRLTLGAFNNGNVSSPMNIVGSDGNDFITTTPLTTSPSSYAVNINAGNGNDTIKGGNSNDTLNAGNGDDEIVGQVGADVLTGGNGIDTFKFYNGDTTTTITGTVASNNLTVTNPDLITDYSPNIQFDVIEIYNDAGTLIATEDTISSDGLNDNQYMYVFGNYNSSNRVFTQNNLGSDSVLIYDSKSDATQQFEYIVLIGNGFVVMQKQPDLTLDIQTEHQDQSVGQPLGWNSTVNLNPNQFNQQNMTLSYLKTESILGNLNNTILAG